MKKTILLNIIFAILFSSCAAPKERLENKLMECVYKSYGDNGTKFRLLISDYEQLLVDEGILIDNSGESYRNILQNIANGNEFKKAPSKFFQIELEKIGKPDGIKLQKCQKVLLKDSILYDISKFKSLEKVIVKAQNSLDLRPDLIAKDFLDILSEDDFKLDFYKLRSFFLFEIMNPNDGINRKLPELRNEKQKSDLSDALNIYLDEKSKIVINTKTVNLTQLKKLVREHELKNQSKSIISFRTDRNAMYSKYIEVQNAIVGEINDLREKLSNEEYNKAFSELSEEQSDVIKTIYPQRIID